MMLLHYPFMLPALCIALVLTGIHTYFGFHVVKRGVIFVDLALSQIAALGAAVAVGLDFGLHSPRLAFLTSAAFTLPGAVLFAFFRRSRKTAPMEALIGITYAGAMALSLLVLEKSATGNEHIREMLIGNVLTVSWQTVAETAVLYCLIGLLHFAFRKRFFLITKNPDRAEASGTNIWFWDFIFYASFGIVVTSSVRIAGVLMVFSLLTIPSVAAAFSVQGSTKQVWFGWIFGTLGCILGLEASLRADTSAGPTIIFIFILMLVICGLRRMLMKAKAKPSVQSGSVE
jgi:zinc/manganese transport system permease protein